MVTPQCRATVSEIAEDQRQETPVHRASHKEGQPGKGEKIMRKERRWMTSVLKEAAKSKIDMPWARGARRQEMITKRDGQDRSNDSKAA